MNPNERQQDISRRAEAFLFAEGGSLTLRKLAQLAGCNDSELKAALQTLSEKLKGGGISLIQTDTEVGLTVSPEATDAVQKAFELELAREIGDAGLEVLAILLYRGPSTRSEIDYIRGVNTSTTLRTLLMRGLVLRAGNPEDAREYVYRPTVELLAHLGITEFNKLPDYAKIASELASFEKAQNPIEPSNGDTADTTNDAAGA